MRDDLARTVSVNGRMRDSELLELEQAVQSADPGEWYIQNGEIVRYGGKPLERREASLELMRRAVGAIPRLIRGIRVLEEALQNAWAAAASSRAEWLRERDGREQDALRRADGRTGPEGEIEMLARLAAHGAYQPKRIEEFVCQWAGGASLEHLRQDAIDAERRAAEKAHAQRQALEQFERDRAELTRLLEQARAGRIPVDVARRHRRS